MPKFENARNWCVQYDGLNVVLPAEEVPDGEPAKEWSEKSNAQSNLESSARTVSDALGRHGAAKRISGRKRSRGAVEPKEDELLDKSQSRDAEEVRRTQDPKADEVHRQKSKSSTELSPAVAKESAEGSRSPSSETRLNASSSSGDDQQTDHPDFPVLPPGSRPKGVSLNTKNENWEAHIWIRDVQLPGRTKNGVQIFLGCFDAEEKAKQAHDRAAIKFNIRTSGLAEKPYHLNFPAAAQADFMGEHRGWSHRDFLWKLRRESSKFSFGSSDMKGVTKRKSSRRPRKRGQGDDEEREDEAEGGGDGEVSVWMFEAKISKKEDGNKKFCSIGIYRSEEEAGRAYDRALLYQNRNKTEVEMWGVITNFRPSIYAPEEIEVAGKKLKYS